MYKLLKKIKIAYWMASWSGILLKKTDPEIQKKLKTETIQIAPLDRFLITKK
jgi:hypothetical protein